MRVEVQLWGVARRLAGCERLTLEAAEGATVGQLAGQLASVGELGRELPRCAFAIGDELVPRSHVLANGASVAVLPPVAGG